MNNTNQKSKSKINIITKDLLRKQIIIFISTTNTKKVIVQSNIYIADINRLLKGVKSDISANYIHSDNK